jgi:hypothetical protein
MVASGPRIILVMKSPPLSLKPALAAIDVHLVAPGVAHLDPVARRQVELRELEHEILGIGEVVVVRPHQLRGRPGGSGVGMWSLQHRIPQVLPDGQRPLGGADRRAEPRQQK